MNSVSSQIQIGDKLSRNKSTCSNYCRYQTLTDGEGKPKIKNFKLVNKPMFNSKKSRNNLTLDGMNLTSIDSAMAQNSSSTLLQQKMPVKIKGFHSKFHSETPK